MKNLLLLFALGGTIPAGAQPAQTLPPLLTEATVQYSVSVASKDAGANETQSKTVYWNGQQMRTDVEGEGFHQTILVNKKTGTATILREIGNNRFITPLTADRWAKLNEKYQDEKIALTKEKRTIIGFDCQKAVINYKNGSQATVWFLPDVKASITENDFQFAAVPGLVLAFESLNPSTGQTLRFTALRLETTPVPQALFEPSVAGYRLLN